MAFFYGHLGFCGLNIRHQNHMVMGSPRITTHKVCEEYIVSKQPINQFHEKNHREQESLKLISSNIYGLIILFLMEVNYI